VGLATDTKVYLSRRGHTHSPSPYRVRSIALSHTHTHTPSLYPKTASPSYGFGVSQFVNYPRFRFHMAPWAPGAPSVSSRGLRSRHRRVFAPLIITSGMVQVVCGQHPSALTRNHQPALLPTPASAGESEIDREKERERERARESGDLRSRQKRVLAPLIITCAARTILKLACCIYGTGL